jgi:hypothetical protein
MLMKLVTENVPDVKESLLEKRFEGKQLKCGNYIKGLLKILWKIDD